MFKTINSIIFITKICFKQNKIVPVEVGTLTLLLGHQWLSFHGPDKLTAILVLSGCSHLPSELAGCMFRNFRKISQLMINNYFLYLSRPILKTLLSQKENGKTKGQFAKTSKHFHSLWTTNQPTNQSIYGSVDWSTNQSMYFWFQTTE